MNPPILTPIERQVARARRRLFGDRLVFATSLGLTVGLALGLVWYLLQPWILTEPNDALRWIVIGSLAGAGAMAGIVWSWVTRPSKSHAALELDRRFALRERITTAVGLRPEERDSAAGQALLADAVQKASELKLSEQFPIRPRWPLGSVPALAAAITAAFFFYHPDTSSASNQSNRDDRARAQANAQLTEAQKKELTKPFTKQVVTNQLERKKSQKLLELEEELNRTMEKWRQNEPKDEQQAREKVAELTALEDKLNQFKEAEYQRLKQLEQQLEQLDRLTQEKEFEDGPAKELNKALSKGDLKKAQEQVDELRKKAKENKLEADDLAKLDKQLAEMKKNLEQKKAQKEKINELKKKIDQAKKSGQDAEALERELTQAEAEQKQANEQMERFAKQMEKIRQMAQTGDMEKLTEELENLGDQMKGIEGEIQDLENADDYLQNLRDELKKACKQCQGDQKGKKGLEPRDDAKWTPVGQEGMGKRGEDRDAKTNSQDERIRGLFDKTGQKRYAGAIKGPSFTKKSTVELNQQIQQAAQEVSKALDQQQVPKDAQPGVREYFEKIGGTEKK